MRLPVLPLDEPTALLALVSLSATVFNVADPDVDLEDLFAVGTRPRLHVALFFVIPELVRRGLEIAVLTLHGLVRSGLVLFALGLGNNLAALPALVVVAGASNLMHAELGYGYGLLTSSANLGLLGCCSSVYHFDFATYSLILNLEPCWLYVYQKYYTND